MGQRAPRRIVLSSATDLPVELVDEVIEEMATRMSGSDEARRCDGLSFTFTVVDHSVAALGARVVARRQHALHAEAHERHRLRHRQDALTCAGFRSQ